MGSVGEFRLLKLIEDIHDDLHSDFAKYCLYFRVPLHCQVGRRKAGILGCHGGDLRAIGHSICIHGEAKFGLITAHI